MEVGVEHIPMFSIIMSVVGWGIGTWIHSTFIDKDKHDDWE